MRSLVCVFVVAVLLGSTGCKGQAAGSSAPALDLDGYWGHPSYGSMGRLEPDASGTAADFAVDFEMLGDGAVSGEVTLVGAVGTGGMCPERTFDWLGTLRGTELIATLHGTTKRSDRIEVVVEFTDDDTATGTYEYIESDSGCVGETGSIDFTRSIIP